MEKAYYNTKFYSNNSKKKSSKSEGYAMPIYCLSNEKIGWNELSKAILKNRLVKRSSIACF